MRYFQNFILLSVYIVFTSFIIQGDSIKQTSHIYPEYQNKGFDKGELLEYKMSLLKITIGKVQIKIQPNTYFINERPCYKIDVYGKTAGVVDWLAQVNDHWGAYVDTSALVPHIAYRNIAEGKYRLKEVVRFDHNTSMLELKVLNNKTGEFKDPQYIEFLPEMREMVSGFAYIRAMDLDSMSSGQIFEIPAFFEDTFYDMKIRFEGREVLKTKFGKINTVKMKPILPENKIFEGENALSVWFSDDENKVPLKIEANMVVGYASIDIIDMNNIKYPLNFVKDSKKMNQTIEVESDSLEIMQN